MRVLIKARAKFYAVWDDVQYAWTFQRDGSNFYYYPLNSFEYGSKIVEYFKLEENARMYKADGMIDTGAEVSVSMHKDDRDEGEPIYEKYTGTDSRVMIWVDHFDNEDRGVEEGDYIEVDVIGFEDAVTLAIMNMSNTPEPTPPTPTPTVNFQIIASGNIDVFDEEPQPGEDYPEEMTLYPLGITGFEEEDLYVMIEEEGRWTPYYLLADVYSIDTANRVWEDWAEQAPDDRYAWFAIDPPADSGNSGSDDEEDEEGGEEE